jgi:hypothetical protein
MYHSDSISNSLKLTDSFFFPSFSELNISTLFPGMHIPYSLATLRTSETNLSLRFFKWVGIL